MRQVNLQHPAAIVEPFVVFLEAEEVNLLLLAVPVAPDALESGRAIVEAVGHRPEPGFGEGDELISAHGATPCGVLIALDRCERTGTDEALSSLSAVAAFEQSFRIPVISVARLDDLMQFIDSDAPSAAAVRPYRQAMLDYRGRYGA